MNGDGNYFPEHVLGTVTHQVWCNSCQAEPAVETIEGELGEAGSGNWVSLDLGENCLTKLREADRL